MDLAQQLQQLYSQFGHLEGISIELHKELIAIAVDNNEAQALVFLQGAQVAEYQAKGQAKSLWLSDANDYRAGQPLRGGIPICWPWFGDINDNPCNIYQQIEPAIRAKSPSHGFARNLNWQLSSITASDHSQTQLVFTLDIDNHPSWPFNSSLSLTVTIGRELSLVLTVENTGSTAFCYSSALHSYFAISDIANTHLTGLDQCHYLDKTQGYKCLQQSGKLSFNQEVDRIYLSPEIVETCICDKQQETLISTSGSASTVVWNPWQQKSKVLSNFAPNDYQSMLCVETANAADDHKCLNAGEKSQLQLTIKTRSI